jgi:hypothetical protein
MPAHQPISNKNRVIRSAYIEHSFYSPTNTLCS